MNYKYVIIIMLLYILYTTYATANNKELFNGSLFGSTTQQSTKSTPGLFGMVTTLLNQPKTQEKTLDNPFEKKEKKDNTLSSSNPLTSVSTTLSNSLSFFGKKLNSFETFNSETSNSETSNSKTSNSEQFTPQEMKNYPQMLKRNCDITGHLHKKLQKKNINRCGAGAKGKTDRDTINNKRICWDDVRKEIVAGMDAESNCVISSLNAKSQKMGFDAKYDLAEMRFPSRSSTKSTPLSSYDKNISLSNELGIDEGPDFINKHYMPLFDTRKGAGFAEIGSEQKGKTGQYADINSYNDVGFTSDPAFLYRLSVYNKGKSKAEQFEDYNNQQMNTRATSDAKY